jgi:hypothetical protein
MFLRRGAGAVLNQSMVLKGTQCRFVILPQGRDPDSSRFLKYSLRNYDVAGLGSSQPTYSCKTRFPLYRNSS